VPSVARPPPPLAPSTFSGLIDRVVTLRSRDVAGIKRHGEPRLLSRPANAFSWFQARAPVRAQLSVECIEDQLNDALQGSRFLEQVGRARHYGDLCRPAQSRGRSLVQSQDFHVPTTDDEQRGRMDLFEGRFGEIRPTPSRDHHLNKIGNLRGGNQSSRCACASAEQGDRQLAGIGPLPEPSNCAGQP
jgi:hypothetical protein